MAEPELRFYDDIQYDSDQFKTWRAGHCDLMPFWMDVPPALRDVIALKVRNRGEGASGKAKEPGARFFAEALVASRFAREGNEVWYGSFKWPTAEKWHCQVLNPSDYGERLVASLQGCFPERLRNLQMAAQRLCGLPNCREPMPPDLWVVERGGCHQFIEVKRIDNHILDTVSDRQLAGLALIATYLSPAKVGVITVHDGGRRWQRQRAREEDARTEAKSTFADFCGRLKAVQLF